MNRNRNTGLILFGAYFACYCTFVVVNALSPSTMEGEVWGGINLAVASGFGLIALALVLATVYGWLCRGESIALDRPESGHSHQHTPPRPISGKSGPGREGIGAGEPR